ncbi:C40 family peptidase [Rhodococcus sp. MEB041]|uniref:C40 family peptidase n=1 Tax=Rhodococcus sp. MEB041 TaxID=3040323 RepID=UPI00254F2179|nr:C40 family peptidase [Rhodococcus sp. MEB041]
MIDLLAAPLETLIRSLGTGCPSPDTDSLDSGIASLSDASRQVTDGVTALSDAWSGPASEAALDLTVRGAAAAGSMIEHAGALQSLAAEAQASVARGVAELQTIMAAFLTGAAALAPAALTPPGQTALIAHATHHLDNALAVHARVRAELDALAARVGALVVPAVPALPSLPASPDAALRGLFAPTAPEQPADPASPGADGTGTLVTLPDGSTAMAPNERAAGAVRFALAQQGTPYVWGGTTPGQGLDCSGLTQSAYGTAGVDLPRLAADQAVGSPVSAEDLMPGDLAVWDGHVAMVVGNGQMVEAGDPVSVSAVRTSNVGMSFHGFYRPTA